ncbi:hypothetical protein SUGI_1114110 [Cryptomeria japonica]|nr:hypothetical protein SUGI_1114110 [Cryptomeria japonica]
MVQGMKGRKCSWWDVVIVEWKSVWILLITIQILQWLSVIRYMCCQEKCLESALWYGDDNDEMAPIIARGSLAFVYCLVYAWKYWKIWLAKTQNWPLGFTRRGLLGTSIDARCIAKDIGTTWKDDNKQTKTNQFKSCHRRCISQF